MYVRRKRPDNAGRAALRTGHLSHGHLKLYAHLEEDQGRARV